MEHLLLFAKQVLNNWLTF